ncbi:MAG: hypothetical protein RQ761_12755 [Bacteroidales bacterium]|nr:hypothetical protein [Bacteroidales bacterium]
MKKIRFILFITAISFGLMLSGQVPQLIDYQGMARAGDGTPISSTTITVVIEIVQGPLPGTVAYAELHHPVTNSYGLFHLMIGDGAIISGSFPAIDWSTGDYYIHTEMDPEGGSNFIDMGMSKLATVPFAFYAAESGGGGGSSPWQYNGSNIYYDAGWVAIGHDNPQQALHIDQQGSDAHALLTSNGMAYWKADALGNTGLNMLEAGVDVAWLYWNPFSQAVFMYEGSSQTMAWKGNKVGVGILEPLVKVHVIEENSDGALSSDLNVMYSSGQTMSPAVFGWAENNTSNISSGVLGHAYSTTSDFNEGVFGEGGGGIYNNYGIYGVGYGQSGSNYSIAVYGADEGSATTNYAAYFSGDVHVSGTFSKSGGSFKIDHPKDPENKYLVHSFVESPDMMNIYNGNIETGANGYATVELPAYFDMLNIDFRYQLTVIGEFAQAIVKEEISGNHFTIQTDKPHVKVSWQITGVRNDAWAQANRIQPEVDKPAHEKGLYMHPELFGKAVDKGLKTGLPHDTNRKYHGTPPKERDPRAEPLKK